MNAEKCVRLAMTIREQAATLLVPVLRESDRVLISQRLLALSHELEDLADDPPVEPEPGCCEGRR